MPKNILTYLLIALAIITRFVPHPANFTAIGAIALFSGIYLNKKQALLLPLTIMFISDIFIGFYSIYIMASVYLGFTLMVLIGTGLKNRIKILPVAIGTLTSSVIFFLLTNTAVWFFGTMYTHNIAGLITSYYSALPFFRNELLGNVFYVTTLVGGYEMIKNLLPETKAVVVK